VASEFFAEIANPNSVGVDVRSAYVWLEMNLSIASIGMSVRPNPRPVVGSGATER
jgi:hypothetical protein